MKDSPDNIEDLKGFEFNGFVLNLKTKELSYEKITLRLETWDYEILRCLIGRSPSLAKNEEIKKIFPRHVSTIKAKQDTEKSVSRLRKQFNFVKENYKENIESLNHLVIETIKNEGYCLHADVVKIYDVPSEIEAQTFIEETDSPTSAETSGTSLRRRLLWTLLLLTLGVLFAFFYNWEKDSPLPTAIKIKEANITLDLNNGGWRELTESERESKDKLSKAITIVDYKLERLTTLDRFEARFGVTKGLAPELKNFTNYRMLDGGKPQNITEWFKRCNRTESYQLYSFNISNEAIESPFQLSYKVDSFNAHNDPAIETHGHVIYYSTRDLSIRIIFPENRPFNIDGITYQAKERCGERFEIQYPPILQSPDKKLPQYAIESPDKREVVWFIQAPELDYIYQIQWDWQKFNVQPPR